MRDPGATVRELFGFLGVDPGFEPFVAAAGRVANPGGLPRSGGLHRLLSNRRLWGIGRRVLPEAVVAQGRDLGRRVRAMNLRKAPMSEADRRLARDFFRDDILRTQDLIGRDLSHWLEA